MSRSSTQLTRSGERALSEALERRVMLSTAWPVGGEFLVNSFVTGQQFGAVVAADASGNFVVAWMSFGQDGPSSIFAQRYDSAGTKQGAEFRVNTSTTSSHQNPAVAMEADGDFIITWQGEDIYARRYGATGVPTGSEFRVNTYTLNWQENPAIAVDPQGNFVITWQSFDQDGYSLGIFAQRYDAAGIPLGSEFQVNTYTTYIQSDPAVAMDGDGDFIITWRSRYQDGSSSSIYAQRYDATGMPQGGEFQVNTNTLGSQVLPAVATDPDGDFVIVWSSLYQSSFGNDFGDGIYGQRFDAAGVPQGDEFRVGMHTTAQFFPVFSSIAMDGDGEFVVAWESRPSPDVLALPQDGSFAGVYARRFSAEGVPLSGEFRANTFTTSSQGAPSIARSAGGDFMIVWSGAGAADPSGVHLQRYTMIPEHELALVGDLVWNDLDGDGIQDPGEPGLANVEIELYTAEGIHVNSVRSGSNGEYVFEVAPGQGVYLRFRTPAGLTATRARAGADAAHDSDLDRSTGVTSVFFLPAAGDINKDFDAGFLVPASIGGVVFNDRNGNGVRDPGEQGIPGVQIFVDLDNDGAWDGDEPIAISTGTGAYTVGDLLPDTYSLGIIDQELWTEPPLADVDVPVSTPVSDVDRGMRTGKADTAAIPVGDELLVNNSASPFGLDYASTAMDAAGNYVIVWSGDGIRARRFSAVGLPLGLEFRVDSSGNGGNNCSVAMAGNGSFVVVWSGQGQGNMSGIWARRFSAAGAPLGIDFKVNTLGVSFAPPHSPAIAMRPGGEFVIAWTMDVGTSSFQDIYVRHYNAAGTAQGSEVRVNTFTPQIQRHPSVAVNAEGDFIVAWESEDQDGSDWGVYARRYSAGGSPQGPEFRANGFTLGGQANVAVGIDDEANFVVAWSGLGSISGDVGAYFQRYNAAGQRQGGVVRADVTAPGKPRIAMNGSGDFIVAWATDDGGGTLFDWSVRAQRYNAAGTPQGGELRVNTEGSFFQSTPPGAAIDPAGNLVIAWRSNTGSVSIRAQRFAIVPEVTGDSFLFETAPHRLRFAFNRSVAASLNEHDLLLTNLTTGQTIASDDYVLLYDAATNTGTFSYTAGAGVFSEGHYRATLFANGVSTPHGAPLAADHTFDFFFLNGDANRDGVVNLLDFNRLASNFGQSNRTFSDGDFNYDGVVDLLDFNILVARFGASLSPPASALRRAPADAMSRSTDRIATLINAEREDFRSPA